MTHWSGAGGVTLHYESRGAGDPVILLHGSGDEAVLGSAGPALTGAGYRPVRCPICEARLATAAHGVRHPDARCGRERLIDTLGPGRCAWSDTTGAAPSPCICSTVPEKLVNVRSSTAPHPRRSRRRCSRTHATPAQLVHVFFQCRFWPTLAQKERWREPGAAVSRRFPGQRPVPAESCRLRCALARARRLRGPSRTIPQRVSSQRPATRVPWAGEARAGPAWLASRDAHLGESDSCLGSELIPDTERRVPRLEVRMVSAPAISRIRNGRGRERAPARCTLANGGHGVKQLRTQRSHEEPAPSEIAHDAECNRVSGINLSHGVCDTPVPERCGARRSRHRRRLQTLHALRWPASCVRPSRPLQQPTSGVRSRDPVVVHERRDGRSTAHASRCSSRATRRSSSNPSNGYHATRCWRSGWCRAA